MPYPFVTIEDVGLPRFAPYGPWTNVVGAEVAPAYGEHPALAHPAYSDAARRAAWPQTRALIHSAASEASLADASTDWGVPWLPVAYIWGLRVDGTTEVTPAPSRDGALGDMRDRIGEGDFVALALFDKTSPHWPRSPVNWHKSEDPAYEGVIAQQIAKHGLHGSALRVPVAGVGVGGDPWQSIIGGDPWHSIVGGDPWHSIVGGDPWVTIIGQALDVLRRQAQVAAEEMPSRVIGVIRDANNKWVIKSFRDADVADDWFGRVIRDKSRFTYAAYFDKTDPMFPHPLNEEIGGARAPSIPPPSIPRVVAEVP
jgi:hypothetical protein